MIPPSVGGLTVVTLASGSSGNCTFIGDERTGVLIDCGLSARQVLLRLQQVGLGDTTISAVLVTHEHVDHIGAMGVLDRALGGVEPTPFYVTAGTLAGIPARLLPRNAVTVERGKALPLAGGIAIPHPIPHDTAEPVAWTFERSRVRAGVLTDLGSVPRHLHAVLAGLDIAVLEFNHDPQLLMDGRYPWPLKQRIRGRLGHLSNDDAGDFLATACGPRLRHVILAHLSEENNEPDLAEQAAHRALHRHPGVQVHVAKQRVPVGPFHAVEPPSAAAARPTPVAEQLDLFGGGLFAIRASAEPPVPEVRFAASG